MNQDEKKCPLTKMTCYGDHCGLWHTGECALLTAARKCEDAANDIYWLRRILEDRL